MLDTELGKSLFCVATEMSVFSGPAGEDKRCRGLFWQRRNIQYRSVQRTLAVCAAHCCRDRLGDVQKTET